MRRQRQRGPRRARPRPSWPPPPGRPCSTCTATRTTTAPSSPWPARPMPWCRPPGRWPRPRWPASTCRRHEGAHPRLGVLDVVPFVPYQPGRPAPEDLADAVALRDDFARWLGAELGVPSFLYGPLPGGRTRDLPDIRRSALGKERGPRRAASAPDFGPAQPDPRTGATAVGARRVLVAYNVWVSSAEVARRVAPAGAAAPHVRALGLAVGRTGPGVVQPDRPRSPRPGHALRRGRGPGRRGRRVGRGGGAGRGSSPRRCSPPSPGALGRARPGRASRPWRPGWVAADGAATGATSARGARANRARRRWPRRGGPGHGRGATDGAHARSCRPRCRTSRRWPGRTRGSPPARRSRGRPPWPRGSTPRRSGKNRSGSTPMQFACNCQLRSWRP